MKAIPPRRRPFVALYERIADAIRDGTYPPGSTLPSEPDLAAALGASRPALREALILLQEDGVITVRRGVGRTVNDHLPRRGFERLQPLEDLFGRERTKVRPLVDDIEEPTDLVLQHLWVAPTCSVRFWESLVDIDGGPACLLQEWCVPDGDLAKLAPVLPEAMAAATSQPRTMVDVLVTTVPTLPLRGASTVVSTVLGRQRGITLDRPADTPVVLITQVVSASSSPILLIKYVLPSGAPALPLVHTH